MFCRPAPLSGAGRSAGIKDNLMASRPNRPSNPNRRRPGPYLPGSLILMLVAVALVVAQFLNPLNTPRTIEFSDFLKNVDAKNIKKVTFVGKDRVIGEVKDAQAAAAKDLQVTNGRFSVSLPPDSSRSPLIDKLRASNPDVVISSEEEHG